MRVLILDLTAGSFALDLEDVMSVLPPRGVPPDGARSESLQRLLGLPSTGDEAAHGIVLRGGDLLLRTRAPLGAPDIEPEWILPLPAFIFARPATPFRGLLDPPWKERDGLLELARGSLLLDAGWLRGSITGGDRDEPRLQGVSVLAIGLEPSPPEDRLDGSRYLTVTIGPTVLAVAAADIRHLLPARGLTSIPLARKRLVGVISIHRKAIPVYNLTGLRVAGGGPIGGAAPAGRGSRNILVVDLEGAQIGILVDRADTVKGTLDPGIPRIDVRSILAAVGVPDRDRPGGVGDGVPGENT